MTYKFLLFIQVFFDMSKVAFEANSCIDKFSLCQISTVLSSLLFRISLKPLFLQDSQVGSFIVIFEVPSDLIDIHHRQVFLLPNLVVQISPGHLSFLIFLRDFLGWPLLFLCFWIIRLLQIILILQPVELQAFVGVVVVLKASLHSGAHLFDSLLSLMISLLLFFTFEENTAWNRCRSLRLFQKYGWLVIYNITLGSCGQNGCLDNFFHFGGFLLMSIFALACRNCCEKHAFWSFITTVILGSESSNRDSLQLLKSANTGQHLFIN